MNNRMKNKLYRLSTLITLLDSYEGISINTLSRLMDISKDIIYGDIISLKSDSDSKIDIITDDDICGEIFNITYDAEDKELSKKQIDIFIKKIKSGIFDEIKIFSNHKNILNKTQLILSSDELEILHNFINKDIIPKFKRGTSYYIKNKSFVFDENDVNKMLFILETMQEGLSMEIEYYSGKRMSKKIIRPVKIINNTDDNLMYIFDHKGQFYRFNGIKKYKTSNVKQEISSKIDMKKLDKMWGVNYSENMVHIKLKIFNEGNVLSRVKKDLRTKISPKTFIYYEDKGYAIYEDDIVGVDSFMSWVYSYGSSMVLLSPKELVDRVMQSIKVRKMYYE